MNMNKRLIAVSLLAFGFAGATAFAQKRPSVVEAAFMAETAPLPPHREIGAPDKGIVMVDRRGDSDDHDRRGDRQRHYHHRHHHDRGGMNHDRDM